MKHVDLKDPNDWTPVDVNALKPSATFASICENCRWFKAWDRQPQSVITLGDCHKAPPQNFQLPDGKFLTKWPSVRTTDYCGKFSLIKSLKETPSPEQHQPNCKTL